MRRSRPSPPRPPLRPDDRLGDDESAVLIAASELLSQGKSGDAVSMVRALAAQGCGRAQVYLGWLYASGEAGEADRGVARRWFQASAESGDPVGEFTYALSLLQEARERNETAAPSEEALHWLRRAGDQDYAPALFREGALRVWTAELDRAHSCMSRAAELGHPTAPIWLARRALIGGGIREFFGLVGAFVRGAYTARKLASDEFGDENAWKT